MWPCSELLQQPVQLGWSEPSSFLARTSLLSQIFHVLGDQEIHQIYSSVRVINIFLIRGMWAFLRIRWAKTYARQFSCWMFGLTTRKWILSASLSPQRTERTARLIVTTFMGFISSNLSTIKLALLWTRGQPSQLLSRACPKPPRCWLSCCLSTQVWSNRSWWPPYQSECFEPQPKQSC